MDMLFEALGLKKNTEAALNEIDRAASREVNRLQSDIDADEWRLGERRKAYAAAENGTPLARRLKSECDTLEKRISIASRRIDNINSRSMRRACFRSQIRDAEEDYLLATTVTKMLKRAPGEKAVRKAAFVAERINRDMSALGVMQDQIGNIGGDFSDKEEDDDDSSDDGGNDNGDSNNESRGVLASMPDVPATHLSSHKSHKPDKKGLKVPSGS